MSLDVSLEGVSKSYGKLKALDSVSLGLSEGKIIGLFGANGAGKSTLLRILSGVTRPDEGSISVNGIDIIKNPELARDFFTPIVEIPMLSKSMKYYDLLRFNCELAGIPKDQIDDRILDSVHLTGTGDILKKKFGKMSLGQQHRVEVSRAISTARDILLMDEPFIGIDVDTKRKMKQHFRRWVKEKKGRGILFTSHNLMENEGFVDELIFISKGRIVEKGTVAHFKTKYLKSRYSFHFDDPKKGITILQKMDGIRVESFEDNLVTVSMDNDELFKKAMKELSLKDVGVLNFNRIGSMDEIFSQVMEVNK